MTREVIGSSGTATAIDELTSPSASLHLYLQSWVITTACVCWDCFPFPGFCSFSHLCFVVGETAHETHQL